MQGGFATVSRNKAISEVFLKSVKADLEISYDEEIQGEDVLNTRGSPPAKQKWDKANGKSQKCIDSRFGRVSRTVA